MTEDEPNESGAPDAQASSRTAPNGAHRSIRGGHPADQAPGAAHPTRTAMRFAGRRVLVADDNPVNREITVLLLEQTGCIALSVSDGSEALAAHSADPFDLILMDCDMPVLDGCAATRQLRESETANGAARVPVLALTAHRGATELEKCRDAGMDDVIAKPIRPQVLNDTLARWFAPSAAAAAAPEPSQADELEAVRDIFGRDFAELAQIYQNDGPPRITRLRSAHDAADFVALATVAHALSGSSASIGATALSLLCRELELRTKAGVVDDIDQRLVTIENEYARVSAKLQALTAQ